jgi:hypothetical protein
MSARLCKTCSEIEQNERSSHVETRHAAAYSKRVMAIWARSEVVWVNIDTRASQSTCHSR